MAPSTKRGKIKAQVFGDVSGGVVSLVKKTGQTLCCIKNAITTTINNDGDVGSVSDETKGGGGGFSPPPNDKNNG